VPGGGDALWAWKTFLRGHHPILMDFGIIDLSRPLDPAAGVPPYEAFEPARLAMGDTLAFARRMGLLAMTPRGELSSTGYALASPGREYLVLQPAGEAAPLTVTLEPGTWRAEWFAVEGRHTTGADPVTVWAGGPVGFAAPFAAGPAVLHLVKGA
jgi:hypothetical protein